MSRYLKFIFSFIPSVCFCLRHLPLVQAVRLPICVAYDVKINVKGKIKINSPIKTGMIRIGFKQTDVCEKLETRVFVYEEGILEFGGGAHIGHGSKLIVNENAQLFLGDNFAISSNTVINCYKQITFGRDIQFSWDCLVMDSDTHTIFDKFGNTCNNPEPISFGNKIWIGCRCTILKGATVASNCVIGSCSVLTGKCYEGDSVIVGNPPRVAKSIGGWNL